MNLEMPQRSVTSLEELSAFAHEIIQGLSKKEHAHVFALQGDLGAGKTAFVKVIGKVFGIEELITSPTFVIIKSYRIPSHPFLKTLVHIDAYRVETDDEMRILGIQELLKNPENLICIEWPGRINNLIPKDAHNIALTLSGNERIITYGD